MLDLNFRPTISRTEKHDNLDTLSKIMFIILYQYYLVKILELKNQLPKLKFEILINYSIVCC
jgi:hypothetical protein